MQNSIQPLKAPAWLALVLLVPAPSLAVWIGMIQWPGTLGGQAAFFLLKAWILSLPVAWYFRVEKGRLHGRMPTLKGGLAMGWITGLGIFVIILGAYFGLKDLLIDPAPLRETLQNIGLASPWAYVGMALYWSFINALLEEYVWRWFVVRQLSRLTSSRAAIILSALFFTLHHVVAMQVYFDWPVILTASAGLVVGSSLWSWLLLRYRTIWPGYISHVFADLAVFGIGGLILFGS